MPIRRLSSGMSGSDVKAVQQGLNIRDGGAAPKLTEDGSFGPKTDHAVRLYQSKHGLTADGVVGPKTRASLFSLGVATTTIYGMRLRLPDPPTFLQKKPLSLGVGPLRWPTPDASSTSKYGPSMLSPDALKLKLDPDLQNSICRGLDCGRFVPLRLPRLTMPVAAPATSPAPFGFVYDHLELQPGGQSTFPFRGKRQDVFILTMQSVYRRGPAKGAHQEADLGVQMGTPFTALGSEGPWTFNPFVQLTDVDRFGALGNFHWWQPYAQLGFQFSGPGDPQPTLTGSVFPVNLGMDLADILTVSVGAGAAFNLDLRTGHVMAGGQITFGISLKFGSADGPL